MGEMRNVYNLVANPEEKMSRSRWEDNIKMNERREGVEWIHLAQDRMQPRHLVSMVMDILFP
jgi:hypothetical protein